MIPRAMLSAQMPVQLRLTSVLGDVVYDTLPGWDGGQACYCAHTAFANSAQNSLRILELDLCGLCRLPLVCG